MEVTAWNKINTCFYSLEALRDYMFAMREQVQNEKTANRRSF